MRCSKRCANPVRPGFSRAEPTWYQTLTVASGTVWSSCMITCSPFGSVNCVKGTVSGGVLAGGAAGAGAVWAARFVTVAQATARSEQVMLQDRVMRYL